MGLYKIQDENRCQETAQKTWPAPFKRDPYKQDYARVIHSPAFRRLQGKTQLFPHFESDFFRSRLTHSMEVAQISSSIATMLNETNEFFNKSENNIKPIICETAGLAHDIGHPPFGHNGERALDEVMRSYGGFEGNAQTLRILARLEKKERPTAGISGEMDNRIGLNLTYRTLAALLKYDAEIEFNRGGESKLKKGYYQTEADLVAEIKKNVLGGATFPKEFKTVECQIMDLADDIAYSTFDLEDAFKAGFLTPMDLFYLGDEIENSVCERVAKITNKQFSSRDLKNILYNIFELIFASVHQKTVNYASNKAPESLIPLIMLTYESMNNMGSNAYNRTKLTSDLVELFISGIRVDVNPRAPILSKVYFNEETLQKVEVLKQITYSTLIRSSRIRIAEYRGYEIVTEIFNAIASKKDGIQLMPEDFQELYHRFTTEAMKKRVICDFIAGMTDRYALEFYGRLKSENPQTIFKPL